MNLSKAKREKMLEFLSQLKNQQTDETSIHTINEIEQALTEKKYGLVWEEHTESTVDILKDNIPVFSQDNTKSINSNPDDGYNFLLEGDNLHSLLLLEKTHSRKIDVIYIDPPYNTGNKDFVYSDQIVGNEDAFRHSKWISFMRRRLVIARRLLTDDGIIFISIDDNEFAPLRLLCDEVFGAERFITAAVWKRRASSAMASRNISVDHEYVLIYCMEKRERFFGQVKDNKVYSNPDNDPRGPWTTGDLTVGMTSEMRPNQYYDLKDPSTGKVYKPSKSRVWSYIPSSMDKLIAENRIVFPKSTDRRPMKKRFLSELKSDTNPMSSWITNVGLNTEGTKTIKSIFGSTVFSYPKPVSLIKYLIQQVNSNDCTVLDFFAGSGTTGAAVLELNKEDNGKRKFILCTNNENNLCETVTYPRLKTIISGIRGDGSVYSDGLPANLLYYNTKMIKRYPKIDSLRELTLEHTREMIQLENMQILDRLHVAIFDEEEIEETIINSQPNSTIYVASDVFLNNKQLNSLEEKGCDVVMVPDYYFNYELKEVGE
ncbi:site-specific DNA-methyltransferase [Faecalibaculum rodentium]|uniref:site-specific DNA-methyltransferase n=1 Tax=Faecalibaculum rodentium TaxID=1702221 RepID=UPI0023F1A47B|nr:site-specific DNA-methyltransferase [Faecalibaculum rodentium]